VARLNNPMPLTFGPGVRLRARPEFMAVQQHGRRVATRYLTLLGSPNTLGRDRLGIIASRRMGGAVVRNRVKRRIREIFRQREANADPRTLDLVVIPRREVATAPIAVIAAEFVSALGRLRRTRAS
jgi:ribonuclease P protein component